MNRNEDGFIKVILLPSFYCLLHPAWTCGSLSSVILVRKPS